MAQAYLKKAGGSEQISRLETLFGVKKAQLSRCPYQVLRVPP